MYFVILRILLLSFSAASFAKPVQRRYDLDGNGTPDWCTVDSRNRNVSCMQKDGSWTVVPSGTVAHTVPLSTAASTSTQEATTVSTPTQQSTTNMPLNTSAPTGSSSTGSIPEPSQFAVDKGTKWTVDYIGDIKFTDKIGKEGLIGDKCRSSKLGDKIIWNCGDMMCRPDWRTCGFAMGPAFYGTADLMTINTDGIVNVQENEFVQPWSGDPVFTEPYTGWGMDTSNVAAINSTHGIAYAWEIWRGAPDNSYEDRGNAVAVVTLGDKMPMATRIGPLLTGPDAPQLGLIAILRVDDYIYSYSEGGPSNLLVGRVRASDDAFDISKYEFLRAGTANDWMTGIPSISSTDFGATTTNPGGKFGCAVYGSAFYSNYLHKYVILCGIYMNFVNMYVADTPYGPWSAEYSIMAGGMAEGSYGVMVHEEYAPNGSDQEVFFSMGPNEKFNIFKITFNY